MARTPVTHRRVWENDGKEALQPHAYIQHCLTCGPLSSLAVAATTGITTYTVEVLPLLLRLLSQVLLLLFRNPHQLSLTASTACCRCCCIWRHGMMKPAGEATGGCEKVFRYHC